MPSNMQEGLWAVRHKSLELRGDTQAGIIIGGVTSVRVVSQVLRLDEITWKVSKVRKEKLIMDRKGDW